MLVVNRSIHEITFTFSGYSLADSYMVFLLGMLIYFFPYALGTQQLGEKNKSACIISLIYTFKIWQIPELFYNTNYEPKYF